MTRSMTGFSSISGATNSTNFTIQLRSENSKTLDVQIYDHLNNYEMQEKLKKLVRKSFERGKVRISIEYQKKDSFKSKSLENELAKFSKLARSYNINPTISIGELGEMMNKESRIEQSSDKSLDFQIKLVSRGINELIKSQLSEGKNLIQDISKKLLRIEKIKKGIVKRTGRYRSSLEKKYSDEIIQNVANINLLDIKNDINSALDKVDIEEEIIRLDSHISELNKVLKKKGSKGLRIDFYMQEINREANTISSKSKDPKLSEFAIEIKTYLNQIREIAANIA
ncbi:MAG: DUF1732 domain-containing protein [Thermodesulfobacteriota bacteirum]|nr:DUF1732 domain-containing protein [Thermodesulfobacteriota bacterium]